MIQRESILKVADNSGAKLVKCIKILNGARYANIGDKILVSVRSCTSKNIQKGQIFKALVIRTKKGVRNRKYRHLISFNSNDVVLIQGEENLIGTRIFGPITRELRQKNYRKILSKAKQML
jgi:large subunit ribosomal protein L14